MTLRVKIDKTDEFFGSMAGKSFEDHLEEIVGKRLERIATALESISTSLKGEELQQTKEKFEEQKLPVFKFCNTIPAEMIVKTINEDSI